MEWFIAVNGIKFGIKRNGKIKIHPEKKSISEKSLNFDRKYSGYIGNKYCMYFNYNIISQKLPKFC